MLKIDGSLGEGGGQVFRTSLALSLVTGEPFRIEKIRAGRKKPGLMRQHLTALKAAREISLACVEGGSAGSSAVTFKPGGIQPGEYHFDVGTAGSVALVAQTVLPALMTAHGPSKLILEGGTHNPFAPPFDFLARTYLPLVNRMGPSIEATLLQVGFYPSGGGRIEVLIEPAENLEPLELLERGEVRSRWVRALLSKLPLSVGEREVREFCSRLGWPTDFSRIEEIDSPGAGNVLLVGVEGERLTEIFTGFGKRGVRAEAVASGVAAVVKEYMAAGVPVGRHLADQLLLPISLAGAGAFRTLSPSSHTETNCRIIEKFLDLSIENVSEDGIAHRIVVSSV